MPNHETVLTDGQLAEFISAGTKALIFIANELGADLAGNWARNGQAMQKAFLSVLKPEEKEIAQAALTNILRKVAEVTLGECTGTRTIADCGKVFAGYLYSFFKQIKSNRATPVTRTEVHEIAKDATFAQMFNSLGRDLDTLVFTQDQVIEFCVNHRDKLCADGHGTFFLLKEGERFFVVSVYIYGGGQLLVGLRSLERDYVCGIFWPRVVLPQLS